MTALMQVMGRINGPRVTHSWVDLLDVDDNPIGRLDGVTRWNVEQRVAADVRGGMTLGLDDTGASIDWLNARFQPWKAVNDVAWPLGVYLPQSPTDQWTNMARSFEVTLLDKTSVLLDPMPGSFSVTPGAVVTQVVEQLIRDAGEEKIALTPSVETQRVLAVFEPGKKRLQIINELLESINYFALWADGRGWLRAEPSRRPQDRPVAAEFIGGPSAIHSPEWKRGQNFAEIPNRVVLVSSGGSDDPPLVGVAQNTDPTSVFSIPSRGRVVARREDPEHVEATSQAEIDMLAARRLADAQNPVATLDVEHAPVPLSLNAVVRFVPSKSHERLAVVQQWSDSSDPASLMSGTWREVLDG